MTTGYLVYPDQQSALARSRAEATARGCGKDDATQYWWEVRPHPTDGTWLVLLDDARADFAAGKLAVAERAKVAADAVVLAALVAASPIVDAPADAQPGRVKAIVTAMLTGTKRLLGRGKTDSGDTAVA